MHWYYGDDGPDPLRPDGPLDTCPCGNPIGCPVCERCQQHCTCETGNPVGQRGQGSEGSEGSESWRAPVNPHGEIPF